MRAEVTLKHCTRLPLLGLKSEPSAYAIVDCEGVQYSSPIFEFSRNPMWDHRIVISAAKTTSSVRFFV